MMGPWGLLRRQRERLALKQDRRDRKTAYFRNVKSESSVKSDPLKSRLPSSLRERIEQRLQERNMRIKANRRGNMPFYILFLSVITLAIVASVYVLG